MTRAAFFVCYLYSAGARTSQLPVDQSYSQMFQLANALPSDVLQKGLNVSFAAVEFAVAVERLLVDCCGVVFGAGGGFQNPTSPIMEEKRK